MYGNKTENESCRVYGNKTETESRRVYGNKTENESCRVYGNRMMTGREAVLCAAGNYDVREYAEGMLICPPDIQRTAGRYGKLRVPVFYPSDQEEAYRMTRSACSYAVTYSTAVMIRMETAVSDCRGMVKTEGCIAGFGRAESVVGGNGRAVGADGIFPVYRREKQTDGWEHSMGKSGYPDDKANQALLSLALSDSVWNRPRGSGSTGVISMGPAWKELQSFLDGKSGFRIMKVGTPEPFPEKAVLFFLKDLRKVITLSPADFDLAGCLYRIRAQYGLSYSIKKARIPETSMRAEGEQKQFLSV